MTEPAAHQTAQGEGAPTETLEWTGATGDRWLATERITERLFKGLTQRLCALLPELQRPPAHVLDVGCGTGATTVALACALGGRAEVTGIDIAPALVNFAAKRAREKNSVARFLVGNAATHPFEPARFDLIVSRFGVMFFDDPVAAFAHLGNASVPGAELALMVWRSQEENSFMTIAAKAVLPILPEGTLPEPSGVNGPFAFSDVDKVRSILMDAGWSDIDAIPVDVSMSMAAKDLEPAFTQFGPLGSIFESLDDDLKAAVLPAVHAAFQPHIKGDDAHFTAACQIIRGRRV
ncbi:MAG: class I SAM-dependent methyltransferase [Pseudomonadota bacterium]